MGPPSPFKILPCRLYLGIEDPWQCLYGLDRHLQVQISNPSLSCPWPSNVLRFSSSNSAYHLGSQQ